jgi:hypothetical protein
MAKDPMETKTTTIEISIEARDKLHSLQEALRKILRKKQVSFDQVIKLMLAYTNFENAIIELQLEG